VEREQGAWKNRKYDKAEKKEKRDKKRPCGALIKAQGKNNCDFILIGF